MSTTYFTNNHNNASLYMNRSFAGSAKNNTHTQKQITSTREGIDEGLLMIGLFCFLVPTMFLAAVIGLPYLEMSDLIANGIYISAAALIARVATALIIKKMAAVKNRSEASWMMVAMIAPSISLILMSFFGAIAKADEQAHANNANTGIATIKNCASAMEIQMSIQSKAI
jgi:hypothetical protein